MKNQPVKAFSSQESLRVWLHKNHVLSDGIWLRMFKKASKKKTVVYAEALDVALCYGWIDGQVKTYDEDSYIQKFTPRRVRSLWSKRNREHVARLIIQNKMQASGLLEIDAAKKDGRWDQAYDSPKNMEMPVDFLKELKRDKTAYEFFKTLNRTNTYAIAWKLQTAKKPETRERRKKVLLDMLKAGKKLH